MFTTVETGGATSHTLTEDHTGRVKVRDVWFSAPEFASSFLFAFCSTVYKYQGADIDENYNIY